MWSQWWNRFVASDPALRRLRTASRVALSVALTLLIMVPLLIALDQKPTLSIVGAVVAINSALGVRDPQRRQQQITTALMPLPVIASLALAIATEPWPLLHIGTFLVVIYLATYVRRFGPRFFPLGMVAFMGHFFAMFLRPDFAQLPTLVLSAICGAASAFLLRFVVISDAPQGVLERGRRTLRAQVHGLLHAAGRVAENPESAVRRRQLHNSSVRLNETALMLENTVPQLTTVDETAQEELRQHILDVELAAENLLTQLLRLIDHPSGSDTVPYAISALLTVLRSDPDEVRDATRRLAEQLEQQGDPAMAMGIRRLGGGLAELAGATAELGSQQGEAVREDDPGEDDEQQETWLRRPEVRTAVQATCAGALAIGFGQLVSPNRWYWAVITAFVVFISANSRGELLVRAWQRTAGTLLGVVAGILVAAQVSGSPAAEIGVILLCLFCGFYFAGYSYAMLTFFITTMLGALYGMLGTFNESVLETRLWETAVGAGAGVVSALFVLPTRTTARVREDTENFLLSLREFLRSTGTELDSTGAVHGLQEPVRDLDDKVHQLVSSARPLTTYLLRSRRSRAQHTVSLITGCAYYVRNLAVALSTSAEMVDEDTRGRFAEQLWALADAAEALTSQHQADFGEAMSSARAGADALHDIAEALPEGPTSLHRTMRWMDRIRQVLDDLATDLGGTNAVRSRAGTENH